MMDEEKVARALRVLQDEGVTARLDLTNANVLLRIGRLEVSMERGKVNSTRVEFEGKQFQNWLVSIDVRIAIGENPTATVTLGVFP